MNIGYKDARCLRCAISIIHKDRKYIRQYGDRYVIEFERVEELAREITYTEAMRIVEEHLFYLAHIYPYGVDCPEEIDSEKGLVNRTIEYIERHKKMFKRI